MASGLLQTLLKPKNTAVQALSGGKPLTAEQKAPAQQMLGVKPTAPVQQTLVNTLPKNQVAPAKASASTSYKPPDGFVNVGTAAVPKLQSVGGAVQPAPVKPPVTPAPTSSHETTSQSAQPQYTPNSGLYGQLISGLANNFGTKPSAAYTDATRAYEDATKRLADYDKTMAEGYKNIYAQPISLASSSGQAANVGRAATTERDALVQQVTAASNLLGSANTQQGLQQGALGTAAGLASPSFQGFGAGQYVSPFDNGPSNQYGTGPQAASNVQSIRDFQTKINDINAKAPAADAAFGVLNSYATAFGSTNMPIVQGLQQLYGSTVQGSQAVAGFKAQLQAVREAWAAIEGGDPSQAIPDNVTAQQLKQIQQQLKSDAHNKVTGYQNQMNQLQGSGSNQTQSNGSGSIWNF